MRTALVASLACAAMLSAATASAQSINQEGTLAFSADRLFGFYTYSATSENDDTNTERKVSGTQFNFLWGSPMTGSDTFPLNVAAIPRLSVDYFVTDGLNVGGSLGLVITNGEVENTVAGSGATSDLPSVTAFAFAPRVGYLYMFNETLGIWPRGGFTFVHQSTSSESSVGQTVVENEVSTNLWDLNIEGMLVITPVDNFAFVVGPVLDIGIAGSSSFEQSHKSGPAIPLSPNIDLDSKLTNFGLAAGLLGYINL